MVPPAPAPVIPSAPPADPPAIKTTFIDPLAAPDADADGEATPRPRTVAYEVDDDDSPTMTLPTGVAGEPTPALSRRAGTARTGRPARLVPGTLPRLSTAEESPLLVVQRSVRRRNALARDPGEDLVWQPRFAYTSAAIIAVALTVVTLPLWIVLYRISGPGAPVADLIALCMMLTGGYLTGTAIWAILVEMRGRVRMVDRLARTGEREAGLLGTAEAGTPEAPHEPYRVPEPVPSRSQHGELVGWEAPPIPAAITARVEAQQASAAATLEASSKLLSSFSSVLRSFGQLPAQVALLSVAFVLFIGATLLSLN
jgi:hypothetical protein